MRFVKEYAHYRIREFMDDAKASPDNKEYWDGKIQLVNAYVEYWEKDLITVREVMRLISEA